MTAAIGISSTTAARRRSLTIITSRWFQRSTYAPAIGARRRFGIVAATKTSATARIEWVTPSTRNASAIWCTRSPNRLIIWPVHSDVNEPLRASRTYGWRRTRAPTSIRGRPGSAMPSSNVPADAADGTGASATAGPVLPGTRPQTSTTWPSAPRTRPRRPRALGPARPVPVPPSTSGRSRAAVCARLFTRPVPGRIRW